MATIPNPATWIPGSKPTWLQANIEVRDSQDFLLSPPQASASLTANLSVATGVWAVLRLGTESYDTDGMHGAGAVLANSDSDTRLTAITPGLYSVTYCVTWQFSADKTRSVDLRKNAAGIQTGGTRIQIRNTNPNAAYQSFLHTSLDVRLTAGEYLEIFSFNDSVTTPRNVVAGAPNTFLSMRFEAI